MNNITIFEIILVLLIGILSGGLLFLLHQLQQAIFRVWERVDEVDDKLTQIFIMLKKEE